MNIEFLYDQGEPGFSFVHYHHEKIKWVILFAEGDKRKLIVWDNQFKNRPITPLALIEKIVERMSRDTFSYADLFFEEFGWEFWGERRMPSIIEDFWINHIRDELPEELGYKTRDYILVNRGLEKKKLFGSKG